MSSKSAAPRLLDLRYEGACSTCGTNLLRRTRAWWYRDEKKIVCTTCRPEDALPDAAATSEQRQSAVEADTAPSPDHASIAEAPLTTHGDAGASVRREGERRRAKRERETRDRHPRLGKLILAMSDEPQSVRSWGKGAVGEEALGAKLNKLAGERLVVLHDRRIPGSRANIDHIAVSPGGVFVIDAKHYSGQVEKRNCGNVFRSDVRLYVGRRDCTNLLHGSENQAEVVRRAIAPLGFADVPVRPVLCFINAEWGFFASPFTLGSVLVAWPKFLYGLLQKEAEVETAVIQETARHLAEGLPRA